MAHCSKYAKRFAKALSYRGIPEPKEMIAVIAKRAKSDSQIDVAIIKMLDILEPPSCIVGHCKHHTAYSFCNCSIGIIPGNCQIQKKFIKDREAKYQIIKDEMMKIYSLSKVDAEYSFDKLMSANGGYSRAKIAWDKYKVEHPTK